MLALGSLSLCQLWMGPIVFGAPEVAWARWLMEVHILGQSCEAP